MKHKHVFSYLLLCLISASAPIVSHMLPAQALEPTVKSLSPTSPEEALSETNRLSRQAIELYQQGYYAEAVPLVEQVLMLEESVYGERHPEVANTLSNLALLYQEQGLYSEARPYSQRALGIRIELLGRRHPDTAYSFDSLAGIDKN